MSKKKSRWTPRKSEPTSTPVAQAPMVAQAVSPAEDLSPISPAQLAANRANSQLSTGPRTEAGKAKSSQNAVRSALTGRTVLLPTDDVEEYAQFLAEFEQHHKPVGLVERELVQTIVDCYWRLRRIQELEYALYAYGEEQFGPAFADLDPLQRRSKVVLQTHLTYQKELRNLHIQEARLDRKRRNSLAELKELQSERSEQNRDRQRAQVSDTAPFASDAELFAALDAGYVPPYLAPYVKGDKQPIENGFVFSNAGCVPSLDVSSGS